MITGTRTFLMDAGKYKNVKPLKCDIDKVLRIFV